MKYLLFFFLLFGSGSLYIPSGKFYEGDMFKFPIIYTSESMKMIMIPGYTNMLVYNSEGYYLTSQKHMSEVIAHLIPALITIEIIPATLEAYISTSDLKISRINYLTAEVIAQISTDETANIMMAGHDGTLAVIGQTKIKVFASDLSTATYSESYATDTLIDMLYYSIERSVYLLQRDKIIKINLATNIKLDITLEAGLQGYNLEDQPDSSFFYVDGINSNNQLFIKQLSREINDFILSYSEEALLAYTGYRPPTYTKSTIILNSGEDLNSNKYGDMVLIIKKSDFTSISSYSCSATTPICSSNNNYKSKELLFRIHTNE
jgi:hypothetical protein